MIEQTRAARRIAFRRLGLVEIDVSKRISVIRWDVAKVAFGGLVAVCGMLDDMKTKRTIALEFYWGGWIRETFSCPKQALRRLIDTTKYAAIEPFKGTGVYECESSEVFDRARVVRSTVELWDRGRNRFSGKVDGVPGDLARVSLAFKHDRRQDELLVSHVGSNTDAVRIFGQDWARDAIGQICDRSQPDYEFDERVCAPFESVVAQDDARFDRVLALIRRPGRDAIWCPYFRVLLPTKDRYGSPMVLSVTSISEEVGKSLMASSPRTA